MASWEYKLLIPNMVLELGQFFLHAATRAFDPLYIPIDLQLGPLEASRSISPRSISSSRPLRSGPAGPAGFNPFLSSIDSSRSSSSRPCSALVPQPTPIGLPKAYSSRIGSS